VVVFDRTEVEEELWLRDRWALYIFAEGLKQRDREVRGTPKGVKTRFDCEVPSVSWFESLRSRFEFCPDRVIRREC
jgi:hypothetical protein